MASKMIRIKLVRFTDLHAGEAQGDCALARLAEDEPGVERPDTPGFRGMVKKVPHLLALVEGKA